MKITFIFSF